MRVPGVVTPDVPGPNPPNIRVTLPAVMVPPNVPTVTIYTAAVDRITIPDLSKPLVNGSAVTVETPKTGSRLDTTVKNVTGNLTVLTRAGNLVPLSTGQTATFSTVTTATHDFNAEAKSDIVWRDTSGNVAIWLMNGTSIVGGGSLGNLSAWTVVAVADFDNDGKADILWRDASGNVVLWFMNGAAILSSSYVAGVGTAWNVAATGDFDGDGKADILWKDASGNVVMWFMNGAALTSAAYTAGVGNSWNVQGANAN